MSIKMDGMNLLQAAPQGDSSWLIILGAYAILSYCNYLVAKEKGRKGTEWFLYSLIISPFFAILMLIALGDSNEKRVERIREDERIKKEIQEGK